MLTEAFDSLDDIQVEDMYPERDDVPTAEDISEAASYFRELRLAWENSDDFIEGPPYGWEELVGQLDSPEDCC